MHSLSASLIFISISVAFIAPCQAEDDIASEQMNFNIPPPEKINTTYQFYATNYYVYPAQTRDNGVVFRNAKGVALSDPVSPWDYCLAGVEGSVFTTFQGNKITLNYNKVGDFQYVDCKVALKGKEGKLSKEAVRAAGYMVYNNAKNLYGDNVTSRALVPCRTIAVDPKVIPMGSIIYIPSARKQPVILPNGAKVFHDGYFIAADNGGSKAVSGHHIDIFCGLKEHCLTKISDTGKTFYAMRIDSDAMPDHYKSFLTGWSDSF